MQKKKVQKKYKGIRIKERIMSLVLAASMGIGVTVAPMEKFLSDNVTIAKTTDNTEDNNYGGIPLYLEDMEQILVSNDSIVIVDDKIEEESEDMVSIVAISEKGEQVYGKTYSL